MPLNRNNARPEGYDLALWVKDDGGDVFLPHQMRNYFVTAWFDWQLKGDQSKRVMITKHPFTHGVQMMLSKGITNSP